MTSKSSPVSRWPLTAVDLFAGAGGASQGLREAGFSVLGAVEYEADAARTYRANHPQAILWERDIRKVQATSMMNALGLVPGQLTLLKACPPCQGFSSLAEGRGGSTDDPRNDLVLDVTRFVRAFRPAIVLMENVRGLGRDPRAGAVAESLKGLGYSTKSYLVNATDFDVPQNRTRFILLAVRGLKKTLPDKLSSVSVGIRTSVRAAFRDLEDEVAPEDQLHRPAKVAPIVQSRINAIPAGGSRFDLPPDLQLDCHKRLSDRSASGSYGRMRWDEPAPTMTTRCTTPACGAFIHPDLNRPITLREAAAIQTFPAKYQFIGSRAAIERQIGNAVPIRMASKIALKALDVWLDGPSDRVRPIQMAIGAGTE